MASIATRLTVADVSAVSAWLAAQPVPADARPADSIARPLPLACGSAPEQP
jgi:cytochrome c553